jgi:hypothetical protein
MTELSLQSYLQFNSRICVCSDKKSILDEHDRFAFNFLQKTKKTICFGLKTPKSVKILQKMEVNEIELAPNFGKLLKLNLDLFQNKIN